MQFEENLFSVPIDSKSSGQADRTLKDSHLNKASAQMVFDQKEEIMLPRYMIRSPSKKDHIYCAVSQNSVHKVVKVEISIDTPGTVQTKDIFILNTGKIAGLENDPDDPDSFYLIDDYANVLKISESKDGKGIINSSISLAMHSLEDEIRDIES